MAIAAHLLGQLKSDGKSNINIKSCFAGDLNLINGVGGVDGARVASADILQASGLSSYRLSLPRPPQHRLYTSHRL